jgi:hypothetical protein
MTSYIFVTTKPNNDSITLSLNANGMKAATAIFLNGRQLKIEDDDFSNYFIGTNQGLKNNVLTVTTHVFRYPPEATVSQVNFLLEGAADTSGDTPLVSTQNFVENAPIVSHSVIYYFQ